MNLAVEMSRITKRFGAHSALEGVDMSVPAGAIHAVVGENGAGKTTLVRVLFGALAPDAGRVSVNGQVRRFRSVKEAAACGIGMVSQHYAIIPELTCLQNLVLGAEPGTWMDWSRAERRANGLAERMGFEFEWHRPASELGPAGAQKLEILKLLWRDARIMILDEPTAMLGPTDADALFVSLRQLTEQGATVILVTHRLPEVLTHCGTVTVLRGGRRVDERRVADLTARELAELIVGRPMEETAKRLPQRGSPVFQARDLTVRGDRGEEALKNATFELREGEVVGVAGVDGNGQREMVQAILGVRAAVGELRLEGESILPLKVGERLRRGVRIIAEDRYLESMVEGWPLWQNGALGHARLPAFPRNPKGLRERAKLYAQRFSTQFASLEQPLGSLSGGNQQRFINGRALGESPRVLLAFQPTRGLDIDATRAVYAGIREMVAQGGAALVVSFDLDELLENCDRILVLHGGHLSESSGSDRGEIGRRMVGFA